MELRTPSSYARELRPVLPEGTFAPARSRILWLPVYLAVITASIVALASGVLPWILYPVLSIVIGCAFAGAVFLGHDTLHGSVIRGSTAVRIVGWICYLPFCISPRLWTAWHNRVHHNHTGKPGQDPDMYPTLSEYHEHASARRMATFSLGRRRLMGAWSLLVGFTVQAVHMLFAAQTWKFLTPRAHRIAVVETLLGVAFWAVVGILVGPIPFLFAVVLPMVVANVVVMAFILSNHNLSSLTPTNDPLVNSLSVTLSRPLNWLTLGFGFHVEHHLFPSMSTRHGAVVRDELRARYPERYQSMPLWRALWQLHSSARVYADAVTLIDPPSGRTWPTLQPGPKPVVHARERYRSFPDIGAPAID